MTKRGDGWQQQGLDVDVSVAESELKELKRRSMRMVELMEEVSVLLLDINRMTKIN